LVLRAGSSESDCRRAVLLFHDVVDVDFFADRMVVIGSDYGVRRIGGRGGRGHVRAWGRSHDIANLFVSDGSQFTTSGSANPTLTIVALAIRQANRIAEEMRRGDL